MLCYVVGESLITFTLSRWLNLTFLSIVGFRCLHAREFSNQSQTEAIILECQRSQWCCYQETMRLRRFEGWDCQTNSLSRNWKNREKRITMVYSAVLFIRASAEWGTAERRSATPLLPMWNGKMNQTGKDRWLRGELRPRAGEIVRMRRWEESKPAMYGHLRGRRVNSSALCNKWLATDTCALSRRAREVHTVWVIPAALFHWPKGRSFLQSKSDTSKISTINVQLQYALEFQSSYLKWTDHRTKSVKSPDA